MIALLLVSAVLVAHKEVSSPGSQGLGLSGTLTRAEAALR